jgi:hypothetical protein
VTSRYGQGNEQIIWQQIESAVAQLDADDAGFPAIAKFSCDVPFFPLGLVARPAKELPPALGRRFVSAREIRHPVFALRRTSALARLDGNYAWMIAAALIFGTLVAVLITKLF